MKMRADIRRIAEETIGKINSAYRKDSGHQEFLIEAFSFFLLKVCKDTGRSPKNLNIVILGDTIEAGADNFFFLDGIAKYNTLASKAAGCDAGADYWENRILERQEDY